MRIKKQQNANASDRFIPSRSGMDISRCQYALTSESNEAVENNPFQTELDQLTNTRILKFATKAPESAKEDLRALFNTKPAILSTSSKKSTRIIPTAPERILDAPEMLDDYYLNLLDWGKTNIVAVALNHSVYLWNASAGSVNELVNLGDVDYVSSVKFIQDGSYLAIGTSDAQVQLWDIESMSKVRTMRGHQSRVGSLAWNQHILSTGSRDGSIFNHDVRVSNHHVSSLLNHTQEVCGLSWSPDGTQLASGGNDNMVNIWDIGQTTPRFTFNQHKAAVKALSWCPWQNNLLATGGGSYDKTIKFWNTQLGNCVSTVDTGSQVCALLWNSEYRELVSSHGYADYQITCWKYPTMTKVGEMFGHSSRVLHLAMSPDGQSIVSAAADENLKFWRCFESSKTSSNNVANSPSSKLETKLNKVIR
jgi:cell division cycle protein 20 (cofactor of APC complex)